MIEQFADWDRINDGDKHNASFLQVSLPPTTVHRRGRSTSGRNARYMPPARVPFDPSEELHRFSANRHKTQLPDGRALTFIFKIDEDHSDQHGEVSPVNLATCACFMSCSARTIQELPSLGR
jgi:hypothetical protein